MASPQAGYIADNAAAIPDYRERWLKGERISTAFVESTVNLVVSRRFAKKQQMQGSKPGAHFLLQPGSRTPHVWLRVVSTIWCPSLAASDNEMAVPAVAA